MNTVRHTLAALGAGLTVLLVGRTSSAREVAYRAPAGCPGIDAVLPRLDEPDDDRPVKIVIEERPEGFHGEVLVGDGPRGVSRSVDGASCEGVLEALVLVAAIAPPASPEAAAPPAPPPAPSEPPPAPAEPPEPLPAPATWEDGGAIRGSVAFGVGAANYAAVVGTTQFSFGADVQRMFGSRIYQPSLTANVLFNSGGSFGRSGFRSGYGVNVELCPAGFGLGKVVRLSACGSYTTATVGTQRWTLATADGRWSAAGLMIHGRFNMIRKTRYAVFADVGAGMEWNLTKTKENPGWANSTSPSASLSLTDDKVAERVSVSFGFAFR